MHMDNNYPSDLALRYVVGGASQAILLSHPPPEEPGHLTGCLKLILEVVFLSLFPSRASLVPVFSFGENELFVQVSNEQGSMVRQMQNFLTKYLGFSPPLFHGRGIFNYTFGLIPFRKPITTVGEFTKGHHMRV